MAAVRSILFALLFYPATLLFVLATILVSPLGSRPVQTVVRGWAEVHHWLVRWVVGIRFTVEGRVPDQPVLIAAKHQAMVETIEMLRIARTPVVVLKKELADIPLFGWVTKRFGAVPVDRSGGAKALRTLVAAGRQAVADGRPVVIFPEGTRVPPGTTPPLQPGFAGMYRALGLPVVPIARDRGRLGPRGPVKRSGTIRVVIGEPIEPGLPREEIERRVHAAINALER